MSLDLPVAQCGARGCQSRIAWLQPKSGGGFDTADLPGNYAVQSSLDVTESAHRDEDWLPYLRAGWLVGRCDEHGVRFIRAGALYDALDTGEPFVYAQRRPHR